MKSKVDPEDGETLFAITKWEERPCEMHLCANPATNHVSIGFINGWSTVWSPHHNGESTPYTGFLCEDCRDDLISKASQCPLCGVMVRYEDVPESAPDHCCSNCWDPDWTEEQKQEAGWA